MTKDIKAPAIIKAQGRIPKAIEEFIGRVNTGTPNVSVERMKSPAGWIDPGQKPEFDEYTVVSQGFGVRVVFQTESNMRHTSLERFLC